MANPRRETLSQYFPQGGLNELGFKSAAPSGYALEDRLYAFHFGQREVGGSGSGGPQLRRTVLITDGNEWFAGGRSGNGSPREMLDDLLHGVKNGGAQRHRVKGSELPSVLADPQGIPDIKARPRDPTSPRLNGVNGHSFE